MKKSALNPISSLRKAARANKLISLIFAASIALVGYSIIATIAAGSASMYMQPSSGTYNPDQTVTVDVRVDTAGEAVNAVQADFTYDSSRLEYQSISGSGSAFAIDASSSGGSGNVSIARGSITPVTGDVLVAKVTFKVLNNPGTANLAFSGTSAIVRASDSENVLGSTAGANYTVTSPAAPPSSPPPSGGSSSSGSGSSSQTPNSSSSNNSPSSSPSSNSSAPSTGTSTPATETPTTDTTTGSENTPLPNSADQIAAAKSRNQTILYTGLFGLAIAILGAAILFLKSHGIFPFSHSEHFASGHHENIVRTGSEPQPPTVSPTEWHDPYK